MPSPDAVRILAGEDTFYDFGGNHLLTAGSDVGFDPIGRGEVCGVNEALIFVQRQEDERFSAGCDDLLHHGLLIIDTTMSLCGWRGARYADRHGRRSFSF
jgi:hypothetical protein